MSPSGNDLEELKCQAEELRRALRIHEKARSAADVFMSMSQTLVEYRREQGKRRGRHTDEEHDLRRAAIVFAGAGLDAVVKQLLADAGQALISTAFLGTIGGKHFLRKVARKLRSATSMVADEDDGVPS